MDCRRSKRFAVLATVDCQRLVYHTDRPPLSTEPCRRAGSSATAGTCTVSRSDIIMSGVREQCCCVSGLRSRRHGHVLPMCQYSFCKNSFIPRCLFHFLVIVNFSVWLVSWCLFFFVFLFFNICVCHLLFLLIKRYRHHVPLLQVIAMPLARDWTVGILRKAEVHHPTSPTDGIGRVGMCVCVGLR